METFYFEVTDTFGSELIIVGLIGLQSRLKILKAH
jgi:hypothetical protein